ncbi:MAG: amidohydrolase [Blastocatellia bacterium]
MRTIALLLVILSLCLPTAYSQADGADIVFRNGNVYTANDSAPRAEAVAVKGDRIVFVGSNEGAKRFIGSRTRVIDLKGRTVVPGMTDAHCHLIGVGQREMSFNLEGVMSLDELLMRLKERVARAKPGEWVTGRGWIETFWKPPVFPTRQDLDRVAPNNPVYLTRADGHASVANSAALKIAGINASTPNPDGGEILKDKATGEPHGMLIDHAQALVARHISSATGAAAQAETEQAIILGAKRSIELGWCQIQDAGGTYTDVSLMRKLYKEGRVKLRIYKAVYGPGPAATKLIADGISTGEYDQRFTLRTIKVVMDGALGSRGAWLLEKYEDSDSSGFATVNEDDLLRMLIEALRKGIQVETHAIGDRANREILNLYEKAMSAVPPGERKIREPRWRVEHAQIVNPVDIPRFARLGVIPSMQPSHAIGDLHFAPRRIGIKRLEGAYAWQSFLKNGSIIAGGTDAPVERGEPMIEFYAAVARKDQKGFTGEGWHPEQAVSRQQALKMFTLWPAYAAFEESQKGSIEVGKLADLTILSADIMKVAEPEILKTRCVMTVIGGEIVYQKD